MSYHHLTIFILFDFKSGRFNVPMLRQQLLETFMSSFFIPQRRAAERSDAIARVRNNSLITELIKHRSL